MKRLPREDRAGLYITVIVHLAVLIVLLAVNLGVKISKENSFVLDFSKAEQLERLQQRLEFEKSVNERLNEMLAGGNEYVHNVVVDRSELKDDRNSAEDTRKLYEDAERLQAELDRGFEAPKSEEDFASVSTPKPRSSDEKAKPFSGPSVLSYELEGRKASHLPIPAYRCIGAGEVRVDIGVDPQGNVILAKVDDGASSADGCLRSFAVRAARMSKFSSAPSAPARQSGYIIYKFIAQ
ncbi:MAG: hypothetical protein II891_07270 [Bacteroidales bacterium]|nr:hypothetical protein [Bacteroidales bacterium]